MTDLQSDAKAIFFAALDCQSLAELAAYVEQSCAGDAALRDRVEQLLRAHQDAGSFLDCPALRPPPTLVHPVTERPGAIVGCYKLLEQIGEGGFGVVFLAEQQQPVRRRVALKILKAGMDTREVIARFEAERQALAMMDHRHIAKVLEAGATDTGRPYFVMELVQGVPITEYCDRCNLTMRERLELFVAVCQAVQHAHQKGIIHRDLKPTNVLVAIEDGKPSPKVIDFGVAKAVNQQLTEHTLHTAFTQMIGTPLYMSPEQAELSPLGVDTRSDIYSLGVVLYELLTGTTPFEIERLHQVAYDELRRIIREEEPLRPSERVSTLGPRAETVAENRRTDTKKLYQTVRGDLDWIVMKCLEKDRSRRYETASELAADVERYLRNDPVQACPPSTMYRIRKFVRRNRTGLAVATVVVPALLTSVAAVGWAVRDHSAHQAALDEARRYRALGSNLASGNYAEAEQAFREAARLDPNDFELRNDLGIALANQCKYTEAETAYREAIRMEPHSYVPYHNLALAFWSQRKFTEAEAPAREALRLKSDDIQIVLLLGRCLTRQGKHAEAEESFRTAVRLEPDSWEAHTQLASELVDRSVAFGGTPPWDEAAGEFVRALDLSDDSRYHGNRIVICCTLAQHDEVFDRVVKLRPDEPALWIGRARNRALRSRWSESAADYAKVIHARPVDGDEITEYAYLLVLINDAKGFEQFCQELMSRPGEPKGAVAAFQLSRACAAAPSKVIDPLRLVQWGKLSVEVNPDVAWFHALGLAEYRARHYEAAIDKAQKSNSLVWDPIAKSQNWLVLAMAHQSLGHTDEARQCLDTARTLIENSRPKKPDEPVDMQTADWIPIQVLAREAEALLKEPTPDNKTTTTEN